MAREKIVIISTHILEEVDAVCTRAIIIAARPHRGRRHAARARGALALPHAVRIHFAADVRAVDACAGRAALAALPGVAAVEYARRTGAACVVLPRRRAPIRCRRVGAAGARRRLGSRRAARRARPARRGVPRHHAGTGGMRQHDPASSSSGASWPRYFATPLAYVFIVIFLMLGRRVHLLPRRLLRARPGRPRAVLQLPSLALPVPGAGDRDAAVGRGAQERHDRAAADAAGARAGRRCSASSSPPGRSPASRWC